MPEQRPQPPGKHGWRWKRTAAAALLLLFGGAIVNVAVAWGCALLAQPSADFTSQSCKMSADYSYGGASRGYAFLRHVNVIEAEKVPIPTSFEISGKTFSATVSFPRLVGQVQSDVAAGWPMLSLHGTCSYETDWLPSRLRPDIPAELAPACVTAFVAQRPEVSDGRMRLIPWSPIFFGFIINTLFYALLLWLLFFAPFTARRMLRRRRGFRGLCEKCAYPIGVSPVCTECGAAVPRRVET